MKSRYHKKENKEMEILYLKEISRELSIPKQAVWALDWYRQSLIGNHVTVHINKAGCANYEEYSWQLY